MTREGYIRAQLIQQNRLMTKYRGPVQSALQSQMNEFAAIVQDKGIEFALNYSHRQLHVNERLAPVITSLYEQAAKGAEKRLTISKAAFGFNLDFVQEVLDYFSKFLLDKVIIPISQTTIDVIQKMLDKAIAEGWGIDKTVSQLENTDISKWRARMIVRTESIRAMNYAQLKAADNKDFEVEKQWIAIEDKRTRFAHTHAGVDGERRDLYADYSNGLQYPGDPNGDAAQTINCFPGDQLTRVNKDSILTAFRNWYKGEVVSIKTAKGNSFTCTPNHPILTTKGFIKAGLLTNTDYLVDSYFINLDSGIDTEINNNPSTFEEVYNSLSPSGLNMRVAASIVNFYGDLPASDVDIICTTRELAYRFKSIFPKSVNDKIFHQSDLRPRFLFSQSPFSMALYKEFGREVSNNFISFFNKLLALFERGLLHPFKHTLASVSGFNTVESKSMVNYIPGASKVGSKSLNAHTIIEHLAKLSLIDNSSNRVIESSRHNFEGFVYTFETINQMYDINSYVAHNCRCTQGYYLKRDLQGNLIPKQILQVV